MRRPVWSIQTAQHGLRVEASDTQVSCDVRRRSAQKYKKSSTVYTNGWRLLKDILE